MKNFSIIAALASNNVIGNDNKIPWDIPSDLAHFYKLIYNKPIIMGRKTYESIGSSIKDSQNIVMSHKKSLVLPNCRVVHSINDILCLEQNDKEFMIIGGGSIYNQFLPLVNKMYLTFIEQKIDGDTYFPKWQQSDWKVIEEKQHTSNSYPCKFITLIRKI